MSREGVCERRLKACRAAAYAQRLCLCMHQAGSDCVNQQRPRKALKSFRITVARVGAGRGRRAVVRPQTAAHSTCRVSAEFIQRSDPSGESTAACMPHAPTGRTALHDGRGGVAEGRAVARVVLDVDAARAQRFRPLRRVRVRRFDRRGAAGKNYLREVAREAAGRVRESCETRESCPLSTSEPLQPPVVILLLNPRGGHKGGDGIG